MILTGTPSRVSHSAGVKPVGPAPTMSTPRIDDVLVICDLFIAGLMRVSFITNPSLAAPRPSRRPGGRRAVLRRAPLRRAPLRLLAIVPTMTGRRALPGTKIRRRIEQRINDTEQRINDSGHSTGFTTLDW